MKKFFLLLMLGLVSVAMWSCSDDDDDDKYISATELPKVAQEFISQYYPADKVLSVELDKDHSTVTYDVKLASGHEVEFDSAGQWIDLDAPAGASVPEALIPEAIARYVTDNFPAYLVNELTRTARGYDVELTNGLELPFDKDGNFVGHLL
ncbi:MAG: hypothetical protein HFJ91_10755 [Muribaculaceae bacterium]|nr:hypothetical protein [Muribaculaceae bacterium]